ncbi:MAG: hypothetical protein ACFHHU_00350 [Porticoccaceae bacterium]
MSILTASKFRYGRHGYLEAYIPLTGSWNCITDALPMGEVTENDRPKIMFREFISRDMLIAEPNVLFVFSDDLERAGIGGQAIEMRGEPNAVGIPTRKSPKDHSSALFSDADFQQWRAASLVNWRRLFAHVKNGGSIVWPSNGLGSGTSKLKEAAPEVDASIKRNLQAIIEIAEKSN